MAQNVKHTGPAAPNVATRSTIGWTQSHSTARRWAQTALAAGHSGVACEHEAGGWYVVARDLTPTERGQ